MGTRAKLLAATITAIVVIVFAYHEFVFPQIHAFTCQNPTIHPIPAAMIVPGYVAPPRNRQVVVFIHGIRDDGRNTWTNGNNQYWPSLVASEATSWDVFVVQYQDRVPVHEISNYLKLGLDEVFNSHERVFVVAHSMGGLVMRDFLIQNPKAAAKVAGMFLLATPSLGSGIANLISRLGLGNQQSQNLEQIEINPFLTHQIETWQKLAFRFRTDCAYETRKTWFFEVVDSESANALCTDPAIPLDASHGSIAKPACEHSDQHALLMKYLSSLPILPKPLVTVAFIFRGPFNVSRVDNSVMFDLTEPQAGSDLAGKKFIIRNVTMTSPVLSESNEGFKFDVELLVPPVDDIQTAKDSTDYIKLAGLRSLYTSSRDIVHFSVPTDAGRALGSVEPLTASVGLRSSNISNNGEVFSVHDQIITAPSDGLQVQLFLWTLWGGQHSVKLGDVTVALQVEMITN